MTEMLLVGQIVLHGHHSSWHGHDLVHSDIFQLVAIGQVLHIHIGRVGIAIELAWPCAASGIELVVHSRRAICLCWCTPSEFTIKRVWHHLGTANGVSVNTFIHERIGVVMA